MSKTIYFGERGLIGPTGPRGLRGYQGPEGKGYAGVTSVTSTTPASSGSVTLTFNKQGAFAVGQRVRVINTASNYFEGTITAISATGSNYNFTIGRDLAVGSSTASSWTLVVAGISGGAGDGAADLGNYTFTDDVISNANGLFVETDRGTITLGADIEAPGDSTHFHIAFEDSNVVEPSAHLYLGDDYNHFKVESGRNGVKIGSSDGGNPVRTWRFNTDGSLMLPPGGDIVDSSGDSVLGGGSVDLSNYQSDNPVSINSTSSIGMLWNGLTGIAGSGDGLRLYANNHYIKLNNYGELELDQGIKLQNGSKIDGGGYYNLNFFTNDHSGAIQFFTNNDDTPYNWIFDGYGYTQLPFTQGFVDTSVITTNSAGSIMLQTGNPAKNFTFGADGNLILPNSTTIGNDLAGEYSSSFLCLPWGVNDQTSGLFSSNNITRPISDPLIATVAVGWFVSGPGLTGVKEITDIVEMGDGDRAFIVDLTDGSLWADLSVNIPYRFYTPDYALVYNGTRLTVDSNEWNFTQAGDLTIPGGIHEKTGNDLEIAVHNNRNNDGTPGSAVLSLTNNDAVDGSTYTTLDVGSYDIKLNTDYTGVFTGTRRTWEFKRDGTLIFPTGGTLGFEGMGWTGLSNGASQLPVSVMYKDDTGYPQSAITFSGGNNVDGEGTIIIDTYNASTETGQQWTFDSNGTLTLPGYMTIDTEYGGGPRLVIDGNANMAEIRSNSNILIGYNDSLGNVYIGNPSGGGQVDIVGSKFRVLVDAPASSTGSEGDQAGQVAVDSSYIYYCTQNFNGTTYNVVHMLAQGFDANGVDNGYLVANSYQLPQVGWKVYYNGETRTIDQVNSSNPGFYIVFVDSPLTIPGQAAFAWGPTPATNIWKRVAWSGDTW